MGIQSRPPGGVVGGATFFGNLPFLELQMGHSIAFTTIVEEMGPTMCGDFWKISILFAKF